MFAPPSSTPAAGKSDQPMVTIKRVMRPDTDEPTVTISVKKDEGKKSEKEKVLFTLVNGQVMKAPSAPDNLIPSAVPMSKELQKKILPEEEKLSKKQKKKLKAQLESGQNSNTNLPINQQGNVDVNRLKLPDGVSISKIQEPSVNDRKYFPSKPEPAHPSVVQSNPWSGQPLYPGAAPVGMPGTMSGSVPGYPGMFGGAQSANNDNVIVVDTNNLDEKEKSKSKKKKNKQNGVQSPMTSQPPEAASMFGQSQPPVSGMFGDMRPGLPPQQPPAASKPREWTPSQYGGYVPPADGKGSGQVLIKSVNGKVVITPIPGTGDNPPLSSSSSTPASTTAPDVKKTTPVVAPAVKPPVVAPAVKPPPAASAVKKQAVVAKTNGCVNGDNVISNGNNNNEMAKVGINKSYYTCIILYFVSGEH